jgi:coenzyme F420 hydrogenase subunit beta
MNIPKYIGNCKNIYVCKSKNKEILKRSSSGGIATESLLYALKNKIADAAIVVGMNKKEPWKYKVFLARTPEEIISAAGSKYSTISLNDFLDIAEKNKKLNLAMTGLPCHIAAIRNMQKKGMYKNIKIMTGLFCGYNMPLKATEFVIKRLKIKKEDIKSLEYRGGKYPGGIIIKTKKNTYSLPKEYYDFLNLAFVPEGCLKCNYYTNEAADISIGDAWGRGKSSVVIERTELGKEIINNLQISKTKINEKEFLKMHMHNIKHKKEGDSTLIKFITSASKKLRNIIPFSLVIKIAKIRRSLCEKT